MIPCPNCKKENEDSSVYCIHCGIALSQETTNLSFDQNVKNFEEEINKFGKKIEKVFDDTGKNLETWYDRTFGPFGPVLSSIFAIIVLLLALYLLKFFGAERPWLFEIQQFLEPLLIIFILVFLLSAYTNYLTKKIKLFRFISPLIGAFVFIFWFWVAIEIIAITGREFDVSILTSFSTIFGFLIIPIAIIIMVIGYASIFSSWQKQYKQESTALHISNTTQQAASSHQIPEGQYKRLYRSGNDQIIGGVLGGIAEYLNLDPTIIRILYIILLFVSFGTMILAYIVGWILIPRNPHHQW